MTNGLSEPNTAPAPKPHFFEALPSSKPKSSLLFKIAIGVIAVVFLGTGLSLATKIWDPPWNPFRPEPEKVIAKMSEKMEAVKTIHTDLNLEMDIKSEPGAQLRETNVKFVISVDSDSTDAENLKSAGSISINVATEGTEFSFVMESITKGEESYVKIITIPSFLLQFYGIEPAKIKNEWFSIDPETMSDLFGAPYQPSEESKKRQEEISQKIKKLTENKKLYSVKEELNDEKIGSRKVYHYIVTLNKVEVKNIIPDLFRIFSEDNQGNMVLGEESIKSFQDKFNEILDEAGELSADLWIGKKDKFIYRVRAEKTVKIKNSGVELTIKLDINLSKFNQLLKIEPPQNFKKFEEIFSELLSQNNSQ